MPVDVRMSFGAQCQNEIGVEWFAFGKCTTISQLGIILWKNTLDVFEHWILQDERNIINRGMDQSCDLMTSKHVGNHVRFDRYPGDSFTNYFFWNTVTSI